jgi:hypothetical protein
MAGTDGARPGEPGRHLGASIQPVYKGRAIAYSVQCTPRGGKRRADATDKHETQPTAANRHPSPAQGGTRRAIGPRTAMCVATTHTHTRHRPPPPPQPLIPRPITTTFSNFDISIKFPYIYFSFFQCVGVASIVDRWIAF